MSELNYNFQELIPLVKQVILAGRTPFIVGMPGIGKSALCRFVTEQIAKEIGRQVRFFMLDAPLLQPMDYACAVPNHETKHVELYPSGFLPQHGPALVCVEDLPHSKPYQMIPLMQIVLDHRIGPLYFDKDVWFIITGNREEDLAGVNPIPSPLNNRLMHYNMSADLDVWRIWGKGAEIDNRILNFVYAYPQYFCQQPQEGIKAWPTPRSWHALSDCIKITKKESDIRSHSSAAVGSSVATVFMTWIKYLQEIDTNAIIMEGKFPAYKTRDQLFAIVGAVTTRIVAMKPDQIKKHIDNIVKFWKSLEGDYPMLFLKELLTYNKDGKVDTKTVSYLASLPECQDMTKFIQQIAGL